MAALGAGLFMIISIVGIVGLGLFVSWIFGGFGNQPAYNKEDHDRIVQLIYNIEVQTKEVHSLLDSLPKSSTIPLVGTKWHARRTLGRMGIKI